MCACVCGQGAVGQVCACVCVGKELWVVVWRLRVPLEGALSWCLCSAKTGVASKALVSGVEYDHAVPNPKSLTLTLTTFDSKHPAFDPFML